MPKKNSGPKSHVFRSTKFKGVVNDAINFINKTPILNFPPIERFIGGGVYVLYYCGNYELYKGLSNPHPEKCTLPIYVGKAVPRGWRTARIKVPNAASLFARLNEHARNIVQAENLETENFRCRYMILKNAETDLIGAVEAELIRRYKPLWNTIVDGFGNHTPGKGRFNQAKSGWDVLHPGRAWAEKCKGKAPLLEDMIRKVKDYLVSL